MGQYYKPINIDKKEFVYSHNYNNGLKLMEHSWIGNDFVGVIENLIAEGGDWHGDRIVWAGDYADPDKGRKNNLYSIIGDKEGNEIQPEVTKNKYRYVLNMDTKEFVDTKKIPVSDVYTDDKGKEWPFMIHPLPLLTCEGNGRGGGDFHKGDPLVGKWARNRISVSTKKPKGYTEIEFNLFEGNEPVELKEKLTIKS
jgi:hypothetical protein